MEQNNSRLERDLRELALRSIYKVAAKKAEELVCYLPKNTSITIVALSLLLAKVIAVATQGKRKAKREKMTDGIVDFIRNQVKDSAVSG